MFIRGQTANEQKQARRSQAKAVLQGSPWRSGSKALAIDGMAESKAAFTRKAGRFLEFAQGETAVREGGVGAPDEPALFRTLFECLAIMGAPEFRGREAMVVKENARLFAHKRRQNIEQRVRVAELGDDEVGR